jgi:hypothetical protein
MDRLRVDYCSVEAARFAVLRWHYSRTMIIGKSVRMGVWWDGQFRGAVIFSLPARNAHIMFGLANTEICELTRVALDKHAGEFHVTEIMARALKLLKQQCPGIRVVVSFADPAQGHEGKIYQAANFYYTGTSANAKALIDKNGKKLHRRAYTGVNFGNPRMPLPKGAQWIDVPPKHRYVMPMDKAMRRKLAKVARPYPTHADAQQRDPGHHPGQEVRSLPSASSPGVEVSTRRGDVA